MNIQSEQPRKGTRNKPRRLTRKEHAELIRRIEEIPGPRTPLTPELEALIHFAARYPKKFLDWAKQHRAAS